MNEKKSWDLLCKKCRSIVTGLEGICTDVGYFENVVVAAARKKSNTIIFSSFFASKLSGP